MDYDHLLIFFGASLMMLSMLAGQVSSRLGAPVLLTSLGIGIFFGENGPGGIAFDDTHTAFLVCSIALAVILFDGGLRTSPQAFRRAFIPALSLATIGVGITAIITGLFAIWLMKIGTLEGMLIGSVVASTDAAAVFLLLHQRGAQLRDVVSETLEVESGINDPMAVFLTITFVNLIMAADQPTWLLTVGLFFQQMGLGLLVGYSCGVGLIQLLRFVRFNAALYPVIVLTGGLLVYSGTMLVGGSGFLAVYMAGVTFTQSGYKKSAFIKSFNAGIAWIAQLVMLLTLGLLVTPVKLGEHFLDALLIALVLIAVARPVSVYLSLVNTRFDGREKTFISWVGLRGAMPIYLALIPALSGIDQDRVYFNIAFVIVLVSLVVQGWTINPVARWLKITAPKAAA